MVADSKHLKRRDHAVTAALRMLGDEHCISTTIIPFLHTWMYYRNHHFKHMLWQEIPGSQEEREKKRTGSLLFSEGCTGFNNQIIINSLIPPSPDSCTHCKKIGIILVFYMRQMSSSLFSSFWYLSIFVFIFSWSLSFAFLNVLHWQEHLKNP